MLASSSHYTYAAPTLAFRFGFRFKVYAKLSKLRGMGLEGFPTTKAGKGMKVPLAALRVVSLTVCVYMFVCVCGYA